MFNNFYGIFNNLNQQIDWYNKWTAFPFDFLEANCFVMTNIKWKSKCYAVFMLTNKNINAFSIRKYFTCVMSHYALTVLDTQLCSMSKVKFLINYIFLLNVLCFYLSVYATCCVEMWVKLNCSTHHQHLFGTGDDVLLINRTNARVNYLVDEDTEAKQLIKLRAILWIIHVAKMEY